MALIKAPLPETDQYGQRNGPRTPFCKKPPRVHRPGYPRCCRAGVQRAIWGGTKHTTQQVPRTIYGQVAWRTGPVPGKGQAHWCKGTAWFLSRGGGTHGPALHPELGHSQQRPGKRRLPSSQEVIPYQRAHDPPNWAQQHQSQSPEHQQATSKQGTSMGFHKTPQVYLTISKPTMPTPHKGAIAPLFKQTSSAAPAVGIQGEGSLQDMLWQCSHTCHRTSPFLTRISHRCSSQGPTRKQVPFNLTEDLGDTPLLPAGLAHFLGNGDNNIMMPLQ